MGIVLITTLVITVIGIIVGFGLVTAGKKFHVEVDERESAVREVLPGNNCGACGYAGCDAMAAAIAKGEAPVNGCPVGGAAVAESIGRIMGTDAEALERVKFLQKGITIAREELKLYKAWYTTQWKPLLAARKEYKAFIRDMCMDDPVAVHPGIIGFKGPFIRGTPRRTPAACRPPR